MDKLKVIDALDALAQENRLDIFTFLTEKGQDGCSIMAIAEALEMPRATLSFHLEKLTRSGLVKTEKQGRSTCCSVNYDAMIDAVRYLTLNCCKQSEMNCRIEIKEKGD